MPAISDVLPIQTATPASSQRRPGRVVALKGIVFQSDAASAIGSWFIRPFEALDRRVAGLHRSNVKEPIAIHAALHVVLDDGREVVAEQLVGTAYEDLKSGLNWTPIDDFRRRDRGGWDLTIPATTIRGIDEPIVAETVERLNRIEGAPFLKEDCTGFVERAFGHRQLFADSPTLRALGIRGRLGDPALPLLRRDVHLDARTERLLRADRLRRLPDPGHGAELHQARMWGGRIVAAAALALIATFLLPAILRRTGVPGRR